MQTLDQTLSERVDEVIRSHKGQPLLSTTGPQVALGELMSRVQGLEEVVRTLAAEVERLGART
jgi:hypothetical protein